mmetsp:Transcript_1306/g.1907  ORF Transcript_1306/g.1907 Transcript_1306/m.1907 type:complete len:470 (+) Transcript_1306:164-1573(+)
MVKLNKCNPLLLLVITCGSFLIAQARVSSKENNIVIVNGAWERYPLENLGHPHPPVDESWKKSDSRIVILIAALRETRLPETILSAFDNAEFPERVYIGVVQQNAQGDTDAVEAVCEQRGKPIRLNSNGEFENPNNCVEYDRVRMLRMDASEAAGPVYARGRQPELLEDEDEFCMQIDAHTIFKKGWDVSMLEQWGACRNEYAVLTTYPTNYKDLYKNSNNHWEMPHLCKASASGALVRNAQASAVANLEQPVLAPLWAAGLSFSKCHAERKVPNDVNLRQVFTGEEFARGARLWTHGYDFYTITRPIIGVYYGGMKGGKGGWNHNTAEARKSSERIGTLLQTKGSDQSPEAIKDLGTFGLGNKRTLDQYYEFSGINLKTGVLNGNCICKYVPWEMKKEVEDVSEGSRIAATGVVQDGMEISHSNYVIFVLCFSMFGFCLCSGLCKRVLKKMFGKKFVLNKRLREKTLV